VDGAAGELGMSPSAEIGDGARAGSTAARMMLGGQLRRHREAAGMTPDEAGYHIRASRAKLSRLENGRARGKEPAWFEPYLGMENSASVIRAFDLQLVCDLHQTEDYARAVTVLGHRGARVMGIERRAAVRMKRQELLAAADSPKVWAVLDEAALRRPVGGPQVKRGQIRRLLEAVPEQPDKKEASQ
jgi:hypothetical protein